MIGRNVTQLCKIVLIGKNQLELSDGSGTISLINHDLHCYIPYSAFCETREKGQEAVMFCATAQLDTDVNKRPWNEVQAIVDKVHKHVCEHSNYTDIKVLLQRNNLWSIQVEKYLPQVLETCESYRATALPKSARKVSLSALSREFNKVVSVDHMFLEDSCVFHIMDTKTRYSVGAIVETTSMSNAVDVLESTWMSEFWAPNVIAFDQAFGSDVFVAFLDKYGIEKRALPPRRHNKNVIESKHRFIRDVYLRLKVAAENDPNDTKTVLVQQAIRITNDLYGNDVASAHELAKGYTRPVINGSVPSCVPSEILDAHANLLAKRKLTLILRSKATAYEDFSPGSVVQVFIKTGKEKRGKWSGNKVVLAFDRASMIVAVPGANGKKINAAVGDVRAALPKSCFSTVVQDSIDVLDRGLEE